MTNPLNSLRATFRSLTIKIKINAKELNIGSNKVVVEMNEDTTKY